MKLFTFELIQSVSLLNNLEEKFNEILQPSFQEESSKPNDSRHVTPGTNFLLFSNFDSQDNVGR